MRCADCGCELGSLRGSIGKPPKVKTVCLKDYKRQHKPTKQELEVERIMVGGK